jgi:hypothetical protein
MFRKGLLAGGVLSSVLYLVTIDVIAALVYPDYHNYKSQMVSELMALGAPTRTLTVWLFVPYNLLVWAFAVGVWVSGRGSRAAHFTAAALFGYAAMSSAGLLLTPMDLRTEGLSDQTWVHIGATALQVTFIAAVLALGAFVYGPRFRLYSFVTLATVLVFGALAGVEAGQVSTPWVGLTERINIYAWMLWVLVFAVAGLRSQDAASVRPLETRLAGPQRVAMP